MNALYYLDTIDFFYISVNSLCFVTTSTNNKKLNFGLIGLHKQISFSM